MAMYDARNLVPTRLREGLEEAIYGNNHKISVLRSENFVLYSGKCEECGADLHIDLSVKADQDGAFWGDCLFSQCEEALEVVAL